MNLTSLLEKEEANPTMGIKSMFEYHFFDGSGSGGGSKPKGDDIIFTQGGAMKASDFYGPNNNPGQIGNQGQIEQPKTGYGKDFGVGTGFVYDQIGMDGVKLDFRIRADEDNKIGQHLNIETISDTGGRAKSIIDNIHSQFNWKK